MEDEIKQESLWRNSWRPALGWAYVAICLFDFILAPILWTYYQTEAEAAVDNNTAIVSQQWQPITLSQNALFHITMGGVLGITAWGRTQEKLKGVAGDKS